MEAVVSFLISRFLPNRAREDRGERCPVKKGFLSGRANWPHFLNFFVPESLRPATKPESRENPERSQRPAFPSISLTIRQQAIWPGVGGAIWPAPTAAASLLGDGDAVGSPNTIWLRLPPCQIPLFVGAIGPVLPYICAHRYAISRSLDIFSDTAPYGDAWRMEDTLAREPAWRRRMPPFVSRCPLIGFACTRTTPSGTSVGLIGGHALVRAERSRVNWSCQPQAFGHENTATRPIYAENIANL